MGEDYFLKAGEREQLLKNIRIAKALDQQHFTSALPLQTKAGSDYLEGQELFVLTRRLQGSPLSQEERWGKNWEQYALEYGRGIARLHKALLEIQEEIPADDVNLYETIREWALPNVRQQNIQWNMGIEEKFFEDYLEQLRRLHPQLPRQLIHRDPNPDNILFHGGVVSGFVDFDISEKNVRLWDVCYCATGILSDDKSYENWIDVLRNILHGYDLENALTKEEKQAVFYILCSIQMIFIAYCEGIEELIELAKTNRKMLQYILAHQEQITKIFQ